MRRHFRWLRHTLQRSSLQCWQEKHSGQGCFFEHPCGADGTYTLPFSPGIVKKGMIKLLYGPLVSYPAAAAVIAFVHHQPRIYIRIIVDFVMGRICCQGLDEVTEKHSDGGCRLAAQNRIRVETNPIFLVMALIRIPSGCDATW